MNGFVQEGSVLGAPVDITPATKDRLVKVLAAVVGGATPEEVTGFLDDGFPPEIQDMLERPLEVEELSAHVDVLLGVMQSSAVEAAA